MKDIILKHALKNAYDFDGKVNPKVVLGQVLRDDPELKKEVPKVLKEIDAIIKAELSGITKDKAKKQLEKLAPELLKEKKEDKFEGPLKPLPDAVKGKVVTRIAPSPSGPLHVGHAYGASLNYEYAKMYNGRFIARIEDTNPENIYEPAYDLIKEDANWLSDNNVSEVIIQSSRLGIYYDHAEKLVNMGKAYVCTCDADQWREMKSEKKACPCRDLDKKENLTRYAKMFNEYAEGEAVLRLKTDIEHKNPAMRDFSIMRINEHVHPKTGKEQRVWPLMILSVAIDDHELGVTHVLNGKDHHDNGIKEALIMEYLGWKAPVYKHWGRINFEGFKLSTTKTKLAIEQGEYSGWDDIRLVTLMALKRRGYQAGAFRKYAIEIGLSLNDKTVTMEEFWKNINSFNRELVEPKANRYFFIDKPVEIVIENAIDKVAEIDLHPEYPKRGKRKLAVKGKVHISESDFKHLGEGAMHRLMDYCNFEVKGNKFVFVSEDYNDYRNASNKGVIIHWLPICNRVINVEVLMENNKTITGLGEEALSNLKVGDLVQLERRFFARVDKVSKKKVNLWYLHK
ncbi:MAG: glutamate--tRNA ligase [archaeon]|nr:glutamate--tRNA ligase [Nanoarchaeota archaeon]